MPGCEKLYDFDLMLGSGHLTGYAVKRPAHEDAVIAALRELAEPEDFAAEIRPGRGRTRAAIRHGRRQPFAGDRQGHLGEDEAEVGMDHPARYALVEIENVHDEGLEFEPIHRVLFRSQRRPGRGPATHFGAGR